MKQVKKIINIIKKDKTNKKLVIYFLIVSLFITIGFSMSSFTSNNLVGETNITVNGLSFNITTNGGATDDRVLHLKAGLTEEFNVILTNLNNVDLKYELIYEFCNDSSCTTTSSNIPSDITILKYIDSIDDVKGEIKPSASNKKTIKIITTNNNSYDVYIRVGINAGYEWNDLSFKNQINGIYDSTFDVIAYVDGLEVSSFPKNCYYTVDVEIYSDVNKIDARDSYMKCNNTNNKWKLVIGEIDTMPDKVVLNFQKANSISFKEDSWEVIAKNVKSGVTYNYHVGDTKQITIDGRNYTLRIANMSTPAECSNAGFSQTACGFVVDFADVYYGTYSSLCSSGICKMNTSNTNVGGWPSATLRTYLNSETDLNSIYNKLKSVIGDIIIDTYVVSSHGSNDRNITRTDGNWESTDRLYLLSAGEVYADALTTNQTDTASYQVINGVGITTTRQLDYYAGKTPAAATPLTTSTYSSSSVNKASKNSNGNYNCWWLRAARSDYSSIFRGVISTGEYNAYYAVDRCDVAPAFRIG